MQTQVSALTTGIWARELSSPGTRVGAAVNGMQYVSGAVHEAGAVCTEEQREACTQGSS